MRAAEVASEHDDLTSLLVQVEGDDKVSVEELLAQLRQRVSQRRREGQYPPDLEDQMEGHFQRIGIQRTPPYEFGVLREKLDALRRSSSFSTDKISYDTRLPGGSQLHRLVAKVVSRQTAGILAQLQQQAEALHDFASRLIDALEHPRIHEHPDMEGEIHLILERLATYERAEHPVAAVAGIEQRVQALEEARERRSFQPWFSNERFEQEFRGDAGDIRRRYTDLARRFVDCDAPVVDAGCGRGEFIELLLELGLDAYGIEIDEDLVTAASQRGLPVEYGDLVSWLEARDEHELGGLALIQVVEHITPQEVVQFVALAARKVQHGGKVLVETVNPQSLYVFAHSFYLDPTHHAPVHPAYLLFLFQEAGFANVEIDWRSPCPHDDVLETFPGDTDLDRQLNANVHRLNRLLFAEQDYAIIATR